MKKDTRKTIAIYVIISFIVFSFCFALLPLYYAIQKSNNPPLQAPASQTAPQK